jgi:hypothetical protein
VFQMLAVAWILLKWDLNFGLLQIWILGAGLFTGVSTFFYVWDGMKQLGSHPASSPMPKNGDTDEHK